MEQAISNAKVRIKMKGLGVAYLADKEDGKKEWEFLFLREVKEHELTLFVRECKKGQNKPTEIFPPEVIKPEVQKIEISTKNSPTSSDSYEPAGSSIFTYTNEDAEDARWIVNLSELYGNLQNPYPVKIEKKTNRKLTLLTVSNAKLYCNELSTDLYAFLQDSVPPKEPKIRKVGLWLGLAVEWNLNSETTINFGGKPITLKNHDQLKYYEIEFNNDCYPCDLNQIDFHHYFKEIVSDKEDVITQTGPFNIDNESEMSGEVTTKSKAFRSGRINCHLVQISEIADEKGKARSSLAELL